MIITKIMIITAMITSATHPPAAMAAAISSTVAATAFAAAAIFFAVCAVCSSYRTGDGSMSCKHQRPLGTPSGCVFCAERTTVRCGFWGDATNLSEVFAFALHLCAADTIIY